MKGINLCGEHVSFRLDNGTLTISGNGPMWDFVPDERPSEQRTTSYGTPWRDAPVKIVVVEKGVTRIGNGAFSKSGVESAVLPDTLSEIGDWAFAACGALEEVQLPDSVRKIGTHAFIDCGRLREISLPDQVQVGAYAFARTGIRQLLFQGRLASAGNMAFWFNPELEEVKFPQCDGPLGFGLFDSCGLVCADLSESELQQLPDYMFCGCEQLRDIILPPKVRSLGSSAFVDTGLSTLVLPESVEEFHPGDVIASDRLERIVYLGKKAPECTIYTSFSHSQKAKLVLVIREDAVGFDVPPWSSQPIERLPEEASAWAQYRP